MNKRFWQMLHWRRQQMVLTRRGWEAGMTQGHGNQQYANVTIILTVMVVPQYIHKSHHILLLEYIQFIASHYTSIKLLEHLFFKNSNWHNGLNTTCARAVKVRRRWMWLEDYGMALGRREGFLWALQNLGKWKGVIQAKKTAGVKAQQWAVESQARHA